MRRIVPAVAALLLLATAPVAAGPFQNPTPLTPSSHPGRAVSWAGRVAGVPVTPGQGLPSITSTDKQWFVASLGGAKRARASLWVRWGTPEDLSVTVHDGRGGMIASSDRLPGEDEQASFGVIHGAKYEVRVNGKAATATDFTAALWLHDVSGRFFPASGRLSFAKPPLIATVEIPIFLVFAGFNPVETGMFDHMFGQHFPRLLRPVIASEMQAGGVGALKREGGGAVRPAVMRYGGGVVSAMPVEFRFLLCRVDAPESYTRALFAAMKAATREGEFRNPADREYLERYNARAGALRGAARAVRPGEKVDFVDAHAVESWIASHPHPGAPGKCAKYKPSFDLSRPAQGYSMIVMDTFRPAYASSYFNPNRYHAFRLQNGLTVDPDSGAQNGFDWGRAYGGRYRFLMLDAGAAPNGRESAAAAPGGTQPQGGDSAALDPPVWEYTACERTACPPRDPNLDAMHPVSLLYNNIGENLQSAIWTRFVRGYQFRPRAADRVIVTANTWHDADAYLPWPSRLDRLYNGPLAQAKIRELIPQTRVDASNRFKYLAKSDPEQAALDEAKLQSAARLPGMMSVSPERVARFVNERWSSLVSSASGAISLPLVNVVLPAGYSFGAPAIGSAATVSLGADPWGSVAGLNDRTKSAKATGAVTDSRGVAHAPAPDPRVAEAAAPAVGTIAAPAGVAGSGFTMAALRGAGRYLGLFDATGGVGWDHNVDEDPNRAKGYFRFTDATWATTATPLTEAYTYNRFEVLDKDNVWRGHAMDWLDRSLDDVADAFAALDAKGYTRLPKSFSDRTLATGAHMVSSIGAMQAGRYHDSVVAARNAKRATEALVAYAVSMPRAAGDITPARLTPLSPDPLGLPAAATVAAPAGRADETAGEEQSPWYDVAMIAAAFAVVRGVRSRRRSLRARRESPRAGTPHGRGAPTRP